MILEAELNVAKQELNYHQNTMQYEKNITLFQSWVLGK